MARIAAKVTCSDADLAELGRLSASRTAQAQAVERAKIVLSCVAGKRNRGTHGAASDFLRMAWPAFRTPEFDS